MKSTEGGLKYQKDNCSRQREKQVVGTLKEQRRGQCVAGRQSMRGNAVDVRMQLGRAAGKGGGFVRKQRVFLKEKKKEEEA